MLTQPPSLCMKGFFDWSSSGFRKPWGLGMTTVASRAPSLRVRAVAAQPLGLVGRPLVGDFDWSSRAFRKPWGLGTPGAEF